MDPALVHRRRWLILVVLAASVFLVVVDNTIVNVALPRLSRDLGASTTQLQWIVDAYSLVFAGLLLAGGAIGDRLGRKGALQIGLVIFAAMSTLGAFAADSGQLIAARAAMGVGAALVFPATLAILTNVFTDPVERAKAIGVWSAVSGAAVAFGPITGGFLLEHFWWGSVLLVNLPIVVVALIAGAILIPTSRDPEVGRFDLPGIALSIAGISLLVFTVIEGPHWGWTTLRTLGGFAVSIALIGAFIGVELRRSHPMLDVRVFRNARFSAAAGSVAVAFFTLFGFIFLATQYFQFVRGYSTLSAGVHTLPFAIFAGITAPFAARLAMRFGPRRVISVGLLSMAIGLTIASTFTSTTSYFGVVMWSMALMATGLSLVTSPATEAIMSSLPREKAGAGAAVNDVTRELGGTLGVAVVGSVFASTYAPRIGSFLGQFPVPADAVAAARESVAAALVVATRAPQEVQASIGAAASSAFMDGMSIGCLVAAGVALMGAVAAFMFLPDRNSIYDEPASAVAGDRHT
ncbi:MAG: DHA2 family efflux MFS transporter permease subunit [Acidobacteria bacterium]|nr:DHA2 family efflux MFS transporter permease subunit [Acidobacteriota bacterium]